MRAQPGVTLRGLDETGRMLPPNTEGEIAAAGPNIMVGYHNNADATKEVITTVQGLRVFRTGDLGVLSESGMSHIAEKASWQP